MDKFTIEYIFTYYQHLLTSDEKMAVKHYSSLVKLEANNDLDRLNMYKKKKNGLPPTLMYSNF